MCLSYFKIYRAEVTAQKNIELQVDMSYNVIKITREGLALGPRMGVGES